LPLPVRLGMVWATVGTDYRLSAWVVNGLWGRARRRGPPPWPCPRRGPAGARSCWRSKLCKRVFESPFSGVRTERARGSDSWRPKRRPISTRWKFRSPSWACSEWRMPPMSKTVLGVLTAAATVLPTVVKVASVFGDRRSVV